MHTLLKTILLSLALLAPAACGDDEFTASGADLIEEWSTALCEASADCGNFPRSQIDICVDAAIQTACDEDPDVCNAEITISSADWNDCLDASREIDCDALAAGILPSECTTIEEL